MEYKVRDQESVFDAVINCYNNLDNLYSFLNDNSLNINQSLTSTTSLVYDGNLRENTILSDFELVKGNVSVKSKKTYDNQSIYDVCLQNYGDLDHLLYFVDTNDFTIDNFSINLKDVDIYTIYESDRYQLINKKFCTSIIVIDENSYLIYNDSTYVLLNSGGKIKLN